jgi:hypothetical protein
MIKRDAKPDLYVLDSLADDVEDVAAILRTLNSDSAIGWHEAWGRPFTRDDIVAALSRLVSDNLVRVAVLTRDGKGLTHLPEKQLPISSYDDAWFEMTPHGRLVHANWSPNMTEPS